MDVRNCKRCGKIYSYDGFNICPRCRQQDEKDFQRVKECIREHPKANIAEVSEETDVDSKKIIRFLKEGRLEVADDNNLLLSCEKCGASIKTGRFCKKCIIEMQKEFNHSLGGGRNPSNIGNGRAKERIRITDRHRKE